MSTIQFTNLVGQTVTAEVISISGEVLEINRSNQTRLHATGGGAYASSHNGRSSASVSPISVSSTNSVHDDVYILTESGEEVFIQLVNWENAGIRKGHHIQALWLKGMIDNKKPFSTPYLASNYNLLDSALSQYSVNDVMNLLTAVEKAYQLDLDADISQLIANSRIHNNVAQHLIQQAKKIANLTTQKGKPRFVNANNSLVPIEPQIDSEKKLRQTLLLNIRNLQQQGDISYQYLLALGMDRLSIRQAGLPLSADELDTFLPIAKTLLKEEKWLIKFEKSESCVVEILNKHLFTDIKKIIQKSARPAKDETIKKRKKTIICELGIAQRSTTSKKIDWQFSTLLRFIVHYLYLFKVD